MRQRFVLAAVVGMALAARAEGLATLRAVRKITAPSTTRLIVEFSAPVHYRMQRVAARPALGVPARLYVDFPGTRLASRKIATLDLAQGPLVRLRASQRDATTARLILDVPGLTQFGVFPMTDPFRLIIDVRGTPRAGPPPIPRPRMSVAQVPHTREHRPFRQVPAHPHHRFKVVLDPGHGGKDPGAIGVGGIAEKDVVLAIALRLKARLEAAGFDVVLTRSSDVFIPLEERTALANTEQADLFVSIHANASPNPALSGVETYYLNNTNDRATIRLAEMENGLRSMTGAGTPRGRDVSLILSDMIQSYKIQESVTLAKDVQHAVVGALDAHGTRVDDLGVKRGPFYVLVGAGMPCVLVEVSFLTNHQEGRRLAQAGYQAAIAEGLLRGIDRFVENTRVAGNL